MGWLPGYAYRKPLVLTGGASGAQTDFQLNIDIAHVAAKMQAAFGDIRFTQNDGTTLIDAWLESKVDSASAKTWAKFPTTPANTVEQTYYMYYGKVVANYWDGDATFNFFDDFSGDLSKYTGGGSYAQINAGNLELKYYPSYRPNYLVSVDTFNPNNYALRFRHKANSYGNGYAPIGMYYSNSRHGAASLNPESGGRAWDWGMYIDDGFGDTGGDATLSKSTYYTIDIYKTTTTNYQMALDGVVKGNGTVTNETSGHKVGFGCWDDDTNWRYYVDWVCVRKYAANPPTYSYGAEESAPTGGVRPPRVFYGPFGGPLGGPIQ